MKFCAVFLLFCFVATATAQSSFRFPSNGFNRPRNQFSRPQPIAAPPGFGPGGSFGGSSGSFNSNDPCRPSPCGPNTRCRVSNLGHAQCECVSDDFVPDGNTINGCKHQCSRDTECPSDYRCSGRKCVRVCSEGACAAFAECSAVNHQSRCTCIEGYQGDGVGSCSKVQAIQRSNTHVIPYDPCRVNPCGRNALCKVSHDEQRAICSCPTGFLGNPLEDCEKAECIRHTDCPSHQACKDNQCINPCGISGICGFNADCKAERHQPICSCPRLFIGNPTENCRRLTRSDVCSQCGENTDCSVDENFQATCSCIRNYIGNPITTGCRPECTRDTDCASPSKTCRENRCVNPCAYGACGTNAHCKVTNHRVKCTCPEFFQGNPESNCYAECTKHEDCGATRACQKLRCVNPCDGACGTGANCEYSNGKAICSCPRGFTGHPYESCRPFTDADICNPNPCGTNAECKPGEDTSGNKVAVCYCPTGYRGVATQSCVRGECIDPSDCGAGRTCHLYECVDPCYINGKSACGDNANCRVNQDRTPVCSCPLGYTGDARDSCIPPPIGGGRF